MYHKRLAQRKGGQNQVIPFPRDLWAKIQATHGSLRDHRIDGHISLKLNYLKGKVSSWNLQAGEHCNRVLDSGDVLPVSSS